MFNLSTKEIAQKLNGKIINFDVSKTPYINSVVSNHLKVQKNSIFIALKGKNFDGHNFVKQAIQNGACVAIVEHMLPNIAQIVVKNTKIALLQIAELNRNKFFGPVIAVTGSFGKTTTKDLIATVLSTEKNVLKTQENLNNEIGVSQTLLNLNSSHTAAVIELGMSHKNEISQLSKAVKPTLSVITGIGSAHFENFNNIDEILKAKLEILDGMKTSGKIVFNSDDEKLNSNLFKPHTTISCSIKNSNASFYANNIKQLDFSTSFIVNCNYFKPTTFELPLLGEHNVLNATIAIAIGSIYKIDVEKIKKAILKFKPTGLRQKLIKINSISIVADCYNASPETVKTALKTFSKMPCKGSKIAVLGDMLELGDIAEKSHTELGKLINTLKIDEIICLGPLSKLICHNTTKTAHHFNSAEKLIKFVKNKIKPNDLIMFKASRAMNFEHLINQIFSTVL